MAQALLVDLHGASSRHGHPLADRAYSLEGEPIRMAAPAVRRGAVRAPARERPARARAGRAGWQRTAARLADAAMVAVVQAAGAWWRRLWV